MTPTRHRQILLLLASYYFYMAWIPEFALLMAFTTIVNFYAAKEIDRTTVIARRKFFLVSSLIINFGILFYFKYFNFFASSLSSILTREGEFQTLNIILPVGISFYTFQALSYTIDVYRSQSKSESSLIDFALYVSFFPQLVAGPIERYEHLTSQLKTLNNPSTDDIKEGIKLIIWGFFKKVVIADRLAIYVNSVFNNVEASNSISLVLATYLFSIQIFCDFSGYTDIARGTARFFGIRLMDNFNRPYFAKSVSEFWGRWHISLSTWFKDYVYIPLGGNKVSANRWFFNISCVFILSGLWHGANWTFIVWGALHAFYFLVERFFSQSPLADLKSNNFTTFLRILFTYHLVVFAWIFFRANSISDATLIINKIFTMSDFSFGALSAAILPFTSDNRAIAHLITAILLIIFMEVVHTLQEQKVKWFEESGNSRLAYISFSLLLVVTIFLGKFNENSFIYFQF
ncbi:MAG TPA: MBOAT family O-acyltransferase [Bacteriovoracaceae bacterium]|nr:MBOAT family O-acyltransferase [Bacteriovoracaceae bacterium]